MIPKINTPCSVVQPLREIKIFRILAYCFLLGHFLIPYQINSETKQDWLLKPFGNKLISIEDPNFGGLSGLTVSRNGLEFTVISDKANYFQGEIVRDKNMKIIDLKIQNQGSLLNSKGEVLSGRNIDSESIATSSNGGYFISFESNDRIMFHGKLTSPGKFLPKHPDFNNLGFNDGLEAIATNNSGEIFAIPELPPKNSKINPIYKLVDNTWIIIKDPKRQKDFKVSDAEFVDDKNLILLERKFDFVNGFQIRLRRLVFENNEVTKSEVLFESSPWEFYNLEGLSKWQDKSGGTYLTLISDDQFSPLLKTEIREFYLLK